MIFTLKTLVLHTNSSLHDSRSVHLLSLPEYTRTMLDICKHTEINVLLRKAFRNLTGYRQRNQQARKANVDCTFLLAGRATIDFG